MVRVLGLDPGTRLTGYGIIESYKNQLKFLAAGTFRLGDGPLHERLLLLDRGLSAVFEQYQPTEVALEKIFFSKNAASALKLGHARGICMLSAARAGAQLFEYASTEIKQSAIGYGRAEKDQIAKFLKQILKLNNDAFETLDASDATAIAVCHALRRAKPNSNLTKALRAEKTLNR